MPEYSVIHHVNHSADDMFELVADVESYPEFIPTLSALRIKERSVKEGEDILIAEALVRYKFIRESFITKVHCNKSQSVIHVSLISGPFKMLRNKWYFKPCGEESCQIKFWIEYEFNNQILNYLLNKNFSRIVSRLMNAFEKQAQHCFTSSE